MQRSTGASAGLWKTPDCSGIELVGSCSCVGVAGRLGLGSAAAASALGLRGRGGLGELLLGRQLAALGDDERLHLDATSWKTRSAPS